jgi:hypothetical protein
MWDVGYKRYLRERVWGCCFSWLDPSFLGVYIGSMRYIHMIDGKNYYFDG